MRKMLQTASKQRGSFTRLKTGSASLVPLGSRVTLPAREVQISLASVSPPARGREGVTRHRTPASHWLLSTGAGAVTPAT